MYIENNLFNVIKIYLEPSVYTKSIFNDSSAEEKRTLVHAD